MWQEHTGELEKGEFESKDISLGTCLKVQAWGEGPPVRGEGEQTGKDLYLRRYRPE